MDNSPHGQHTWFLPGETTQATFDSELDFYPASSVAEASWSEGSKGAGLVPASLSATPNVLGTGSLSESLSLKAQLAQGPLASLLSAAGNTFHNRSIHDSSDLPQHTYTTHRSNHGHSQNHGHSHGHTRSRTQPHHAPSSHLPRVPPPSQYRVVITNFRICSLSHSSIGHDIITFQIALNSIASLTLHEHKIVLALKFDSPQYIVSQHPGGSPAVGEVMSILRRLIFNDDVRGRFPHQMGRTLLEHERSFVQRNVCLWTTEDIINLSPISRNDEFGHDCLGDLSEQELRERRELGWTGGYDIFHEFRRLKFDASLWSVAHLNASFDLSPTYPERFIMPGSFLDPGSGSTPADTAARMWSSPSTPRYLGDAPPSAPQGSAQLLDSPNACIKQLTAFRSNKRFPLVCWKSPESGLVLMRSSQPMVGFLGARGPEDELYIRTILNTAARENRRSHPSPKVPPKLCIVDARAFATAVANGYVGGGRENPDHYPNATISFMSLGNIHAIAQSHLSLLKAVSTQSESANWFTLIESTGWLNHVADLLKAASGRDGIVGKMLDANCSVLVHCTDGWDRTTQLVSLAQILLDPYYRTIHGLRVLIEKEWLSCGHPFQSRTEACSGQKKPGSPSPMDEEPLDSWRSSKSMIHSSPNGAKESISFARKWRRTTHPYSDPSLSHHLEPRSPPSETSHHSQSNLPFAAAAAPASAPSAPPTHQQPKQTPVQTVPISPSPVFLLFLTCLHHIVLQHPNRFEFNDYLLVVLARAVGGSSPFGDFLCNDERERAQDRLRQQTPSIWKWIQENYGWFANRDYIPKLDETNADNPSAWRQSVLHVQTGGRFNTLWSEYYFNTTPTLYPDPRTVLATASFHADCRSRQPLLSQQHRLGLLTDRWYASQFDEEQLQQLVYPGPFTSPTRQHQLRSGGPSKTLIIPPALALLKGQDMRLYFELVGKLRDRREEKARQVFLKWQARAKRQREEKPAREDGWNLVRGRSGSNSSQGESALYHEDDGDEWDRKGSSDGRRTPELKVIVARRGIEVAMGRILDGGPFFGAGSLVYEDGPESEDESGAEVMGDGGEDKVVSMAELDEDDLEGAFDDFGFPVNTDDAQAFVAV